MTQTEKELLLKDLFARLPHGVMCQTDEHGKNYKLKGINKHKGIWWYEFDGFRIIKLPKPYLRPMSSMTEEEKKEYGKVCELDTRILANHPMNGEPFPALYNSQDWLNKKMFAYRTIDGKDMFELGLALKAPEGMYE